MKYEERKTEVFGLGSWKYGMPEQRRRLLKKQVGVKNQEGQRENRKGHII